MTAFGIIDQMVERPLLGAKLPRPFDVRNVHYPDLSSQKETFRIVPSPGRAATSELVLYRGFESYIRINSQSHIRSHTGVESPTCLLARNVKTNLNY